MKKKEYILCAAIWYKEIELKKIFTNHQKNAEKYFKNNPNFIVLDWEKGNGWKELCRFLEKPIPQCPFPHRLKWDQKTKKYKKSKID
jgi:hypothetical protein